MTSEQHFQELVQKHLDGLLSETELVELDRLLARSPEAARAFALTTQMDNILVALHQGNNTATVSDPQPRAPDQSEPGDAHEGELIPLAPPASTFGRVLLVAAMLLATLAGSIYFMPGSQGRVLGTFDSVDDQVVVMRGGEIIAVSRGMLLQSADQVITPATGEAVVRYPGEATTIRMAPGTSTRFLMEKKGKRIDLTSGRLECAVAHQPRENPLILRTRFAEAVVLGTVFSLDSNDRVTRLEVRQGRVSLRDAEGRKVIAEAGSFAEVGDGVPLNRGKLIVPTKPVKKDKPDATTPPVVPQPAAPAAAEEALSEPWLYYADMSLSVQSGRFQIDLRPEKLAPHQLFKGDRSGLSESYLNMLGDAPLRHVRDILFELNRSFSSRSGPWVGRQALFDFHILLNVQSRDKVAPREYRHQFHLGLGERPGEFFVDAGNRPWQVPIGDFADETGYRAFLQYFLAPFQELREKLPEGDVLALSLVMLPPVMDPTLADRFPGEPGPALLKSFLAESFDADFGAYTLGGACFSRRSDGTWQRESDFFPAFGRMLVENGRAFSRLTPNQQAVKAYEAWVHYFPSDERSVRQLQSLYREQGQGALADSLVVAHQPIFIGRRPSGPLPGPEAVGTRRDSAAVVRILSPQTGETVGGGNVLRWLIESGKEPVLRVDAMVDGKPIGAFREPPYGLDLVLPGDVGDHELRVVAHFNGGTYAEDTVRVRVGRGDTTFPAGLQVLVSDADGAPLANPAGVSLSAFEAGVPAPLHPVSREIPLRVALVLDTSLSLRGSKLENVQFALARFLDGLQPGDRAALYSFDRQVTRLSDFVDRGRGLVPLLYTLVPKLETSLNDALWTAASDLAAQPQGTRVLILVSDGFDTHSFTNEAAVARLLTGSSIRVYPIMLRGNSRFLNQLAEQSGAFAESLSDPDRVAACFQRIGQELRALNYFTYDSRYPSPVRRDLELKANNELLRLRWLKTN